MTASPPLVELIDIRKSFGATEVLRGVSFAAREGEVVAIIGSSGSGKSTLLRCINMLEVPDSGTVKVAGETIRLAGVPPHRHVADEAQIRRIRSGIGMVFQQFNLWSHMTVLGNVMEAPVVVQQAFGERGRTLRGALRRQQHLAAGGARLYLHPSAQGRG